MTEKRKNLLFIAVILAMAAVLWLAAHHGGTGRTAVLRYGTPQTEQRNHLCEGFGTLKNEGDWAACMPARASLTIE